MHAGTTVGRRFTLLHPGSHDLPGVTRWVAQDERLAQRVDLDILVGPGADDARRVAALSAKVRDPRFPRVLSSGVHVDDDGRHTYIVTERPRGLNAAKLVDAAPIAPAAAAALVGEASRALEEAAAVGVHHGAVRAEALTVTPAGRVLVTGLGVDGVIARADGGPGVDDEATDVAALCTLYAQLVTGRHPRDLVASQVPDDLGTAGTALVHGAIAGDPPATLAHVSRALGTADARALRAAAGSTRRSAPSAASPEAPVLHPAGMTHAGDAGHSDTAHPSDPAHPTGPTDLADATAPVTPTTDPIPASAPLTPEDIDAPDDAAIAAATAAADHDAAEHLMAGEASLDEVLAEARTPATGEQPIAGHVKDAPLEMLEEIVDDQEARRSGSLWQLVLERLHRWWPGSQPITDALERARERAARPAPFNVGPLVLGVAIVAVIVVAIVAFSQLTTVTVPEGYEPGPTSHEYPAFTHTPSPEPSAANDG